MLYHKVRLTKKSLYGAFKSNLKDIIIYTMKCYTVNTLQLTGKDNGFTFCKTHRKNGITFKDKNTYSGRFEIKEIDEYDVEFSIYI